jgi:hypothetical protein
MSSSLRTAEHAVANVLPLLMMMQIMNVRQQLEAEHRMWPELQEQLTCQILHIPPEAVAKLKASEMSGSYRLVPQTVEALLS